MSHSASAQSWNLFLAVLKNSRTSSAVLSFFPFKCGILCYTGLMQSVEEKAAYLKRWHEAHPDYSRNYNKQYWKNHPTTNREYRKNNLASVRAYEREQYRKNATKKREQRKRWVKANYDKVLAGVRQYNASHPGIRKAIEKRYREKRPEIQIAVKANRRARQMNAEGSHTPEDILLIWERQGRKCAVSNCPYPISEKSGKHKYHVDHIIPLKDPNGTNWPSNLQILCSHHNRSKWALSPEKWAKRLAASLQTRPVSG